MENSVLRGLENLFGRVGGPMSFRLILQPAVAILLAVRAGRRDAREGGRPFLWAALSDRAGRRELMRQGWTDVGKVFIVALALDATYQVVVHSSIYPLELLLTATLLALVPYAIVRGPVTRLERRRLAVSRADGRTGTRVTPGEAPPPERQAD